MNVTEVQLRSIIIDALKANKVKATEAKTIVSTIPTDGLLAKASELGINDAEDPFILSTDVIASTAEVEDAIADAIHRPTVLNIVGKFIGSRMFDLKDENGELALDDNGDVRQVCVIDIQAIGEDPTPVFITPKQLIGFALKQGEYVKVTVEVRKAHITQYTTKTGDIRFHGKETDPKGKVEYGFITGSAYDTGSALFNKAMSYPADQQLNAVQALKAFAVI